MLKGSTPALQPREGAQIHRTGVWLSTPGLVVTGGACIFSSADFVCLYVQYYNEYNTQMDTVTPHWINSGK